MCCPKRAVHTWCHQVLALLSGVKYYSHFIDGDTEALRDFCWHKTSQLVIELGLWTGATSVLLTAVTLESDWGLVLSGQLVNIS